jgi:hypothetical protein
MCTFPLCSTTGCLLNLLPSLRLKRWQNAETFWKDVVCQMAR